MIWTAILNHIPSLYSKSLASQATSLWVKFQICELQVQAESSHLAETPNQASSYKSKQNL